MLTATPVLENYANIYNLMRCLSKNKKLITLQEFEKFDEAQKIDWIRTNVKGYIARADPQGNSPWQFANRYLFRVYVPPSDFQRFTYVYKVRDIAAGIGLRDHKNLKSLWLQNKGVQVEKGDKVMASSKQYGFDLYSATVINTEPLTIAWDDNSGQETLNRADVFKMLKEGDRLGAFRVSGECIGTVKEIPNEENAYNYVVRMDNDEYDSVIPPYLVAQVAEDEESIRDDFLKQQERVRALGYADVYSPAIRYTVWPH